MAKNKSTNIKKPPAKRKLSKTKLRNPDSELRNPYSVMLVTGAGKGGALVRSY